MGKMNKKLQAPSLTIAIDFLYLVASLDWPSMFVLVLFWRKKAAEQFKKNQIKKMRM